MTLVAALLVILPMASDKDFQQLADNAAWEWKADEATVLHSLLQSRCDFQIELIRPKGTFGSDLLIRFTDGDKQVHSLRGTASTVFAVHENVLYLAEFQPHASGCSVVAFDLKAQKQLWKTPLKGLGPISHFRYVNRVALQLEDGAVRVRGFESAGKYIEYLDMKNGKTVGHRIFK